MPAITTILIPERFTSAVLAGYALQFLREWENAVRPRPAEETLMTDAIQFALDTLKMEGVIN